MDAPKTNQTRKALSQEEYKRIMTEVIVKQIAILGDTVAVLKARSIPNIVVRGDGVVEEVRGDARKALELLVHAYIELSGKIVQAALGSMFEGYPSLQGITKD